MKLSEVESVLARLRRKPLSTIAVILAILATITLLTWITTFTQENAKRLATSRVQPAPTSNSAEIKSTVIDLTKNGFIGLRTDISAIEAMQRFGLPKDDPPNLHNLEYPNFTMGFGDNDSLSFIRFNWKSDSHWKTTSGLSFGANRSDVLAIFGEPTSATLAGGMYYYDHFCVEFDDANNVSDIILYIKRANGFSFAELEKEFLDLLIKKPKLAQELLLDKNAKAWIPIVVYRILSRRDIRSSEDEELIKLTEENFPELILLLKQADQEPPATP